MITTTSILDPGYQLGIDIGGSKTHLLLAQHGVIVAELRGPSANPASVGLTETTRQLQALFGRLRRLPGRDRVLDQISSVCVGAAGVDTPEQERRIAGLLAQELPSAEIRVVHDSALLLAAAGTDVGIALIAGTGSVAWGRAEDGREARAGGWGYVLGDDGSGYGIARAAVRHALGRLDAGLGPDPLATALAADCGLDRPGLLLDHFYAEPARRYWAERSRVVVELAAAGDRAATAVVGSAADALAELVERVSLRLAIAGPVVLAGGVLVHQPLVRRLLAARLAGVGITDLRLLDVDPALGAVRLARSPAPAAT
jgi:N-acetylglucosamine kinase-like BadF-type ATPase